MWILGRMSVLCMRVPVHNMEKWHQNVVLLKFTVLKEGCLWTREELILIILEKKVQRWGESRYGICSHLVYNGQQLKWSLKLNWKSWSVWTCWHHNDHYPVLTFDYWFILSHFISYLYWSIKHFYSVNIYNHNILIKITLHPFLNN